MKTSLSILTASMMLLAAVPLATFAEETSTEAVSTEITAPVPEKTPEQVCRERLEAQGLDAKQPAMLTLLRRCISTFNQNTENQRRATLLQEKTSMIGARMRGVVERRIAGTKRSIKMNAMKRQKNTVLQNAKKNTVRYHRRDFYGTPKTATGSSASGTGSSMNP